MADESTEVTLIETTVDKTHPLWKAWDDDDWNGATASQWLLNCKSVEIVRLFPPKEVSDDLLNRIRVAVARQGCTVIIEGR